jgi:MATE family multidrug resistance protein
MLVLLSGLLPIPQLSISTMAITANMHDSCYLMTAGLGSATSTRVVQSLGGGQPVTARLTVMMRRVTCVVTPGGSLASWGDNCSAH